MTKQEKHRMAETLGKGDDKYYVYMLIDPRDNKPFYVGKGEGARVFDHESSAEDAARQIVASRGDDMQGVEALTKEERKKLTDKIRIILDACKQTGKEIEKVIVKWGLTSNEAFMCESALINGIRYLQDEHANLKLGSLANILNGHASKREEFVGKNLDLKSTRGRDVATFLKNVAIPSVRFRRLNIRVPICFITANEAMRELNGGLPEGVTQDEFIYDSYRGFWKLSERMLRYVKFVVCLNAQVVRAVYAVNGSSWRRMKDFKLSEMPAWPSCFREDDRKRVQSNSYNDFLAMNPHSHDTVHQYEMGRCRFGFSRIDSRDIEVGLQRTYGKLCKLQGSVLSDEFFRNQNAHYNFEIGRSGEIKYYTRW